MIQSRSIIWWYTLSMYCLRDWSWPGVMATTPEWSVVWHRDIQEVHVEGCPCLTTNHKGVVAATPDRPWSILIITWLINFVSNVFTTKYIQNHHQIERCCLLASIVTSCISPPSGATTTVPCQKTMQPCYIYILSAMIIITCNRQILSFCKSKFSHSICYLSCEAVGFQEPKILVAGIYKIWDWYSNRTLSWKQDLQ